MTDNVPLLNEFYLKIIRSIRKEDRNHLILLDPNMWAKEIATLHDELFADPQAIPSLHHYFSEDAGFKSLAVYPAVVEGKKYDRAALERTLDAKHDQRRIARPVMVGEFGVFRGFPQPFAGKSLGQPFATQLAITRDLVSIFEEKGWSWTMW